MKKFVYAKSTTSIGGGPHGGTYDLKAGEVYAADHPAVVARPEFFSDTPTWANTLHGYREVEVIEQATAAPGEKRRGK